MSAPAIEVRDLSHTYPDGSVALDGVDLHVHPGERVALLGPNGAGKTTLALHLNGVLRATRGEVEVDGRALDDRTVADVRRRVGLVFQDSDDQLFLPTVREDVAFGPANLGVTGEELDRRVASALSAVGMQHVAHKAPHHLSGGEKRRVAIATVLAMDPSILVLDEPAANLDAQAQHELIDLLNGLDVALLVVTHDLVLALQLCERGIVLDGGRVVADDSIRGLLRDEEALARHRLLLPFGFDRRAL